MQHDDHPGALDALLRSAAPPVSPPHRSTSRAVRAVIRSASRHARSRASRRRRGVVFVFVGAGLVATSGAALYGATVSDAWMPWGQGVQHADIEWQVTLPSGIQCVDRLSSTKLTGEQVSAVTAALRDPAALLAADDGAVRELFLTDLALDGVDMEPAIDEAYRAFASLDVDAGRGDIKEEDLGAIDWTPEDDLFKHIYMRLVEYSLRSSLAGQGFDLTYAFTPDTACVVAK